MEINQADYRKMAIQKSVEKARQEAMERAKQVSDAPNQNNQRPVEKTPIQNGAMVQNQNRQNVSNQNNQRTAQSPVVQNQNRPNVSTQNNQRTAQSAVVQNQNRPNFGNAGNGQPNVANQNNQQNKSLSGLKTQFNKLQQNNATRSPNVQNGTRNSSNFRNTQSTEIKRPSALEPKKTIVVSNENKTDLTSNNNTKIATNNVTNIQMDARVQNAIQAQRTASAQIQRPMQQKPLQSSNPRPVAQQPKYKVANDFSGKQKVVVEKIVPSKPSTTINNKQNMSRLQQVREEQRNKAAYDTIPAKDKMKIIFLGGVGEIGKNMTAIEYQNEIVVIDCGLSFPGEDMPGIDLVIPDTTYLKDNRSKVKAFLITHGHEDHIGALPYVLRDIKAPIYTNRLTAAMIDNKIKEHKLDNVVINVIETRKAYKIGKFEVEFVDVNHSIPDAVAIKVKTEAGVIFHTGDFKIDFQPIDGKMIDLPRIAEIGNEGVDLLLCESTNVEFEGYTLSESTVGEKLDKIFEDNKTRRMFVATFSSNIYRVQQVLTLAQKYGRKVAIIGRSMLKNLEAAIRVEKLDFPKSLFIDVEKSNSYDDKEILILCTGSQGESNAALSRLSSGDYTKIEISTNDTVIFSSSPIPGNESSINKVINNLYKKGALVIYENVHASGHACIEEIKTMHSLIKPTLFVPIHGEYRHLKKHALLTESMGMDPKNITICDLGDVYEFTKETGKIIGKVQAGQILVDGYGLGDVSSSVLSERKALSEEGLVVVVIGIDQKLNRLVSSPIVITRGCVYDDEEVKIIEEAKNIVILEIEAVLAKKMVDWEEAKQIIRKPLRNYFMKKTKRNPMILPVIYKINQ